MCEFDVILNGKNVYEDAVYARADGNKVFVRNVLGTTKVFEKCRIVEVDVSSERLVLSST